MSENAAAGPCGARAVRSLLIPYKFSGLLLRLWFVVLTLALGYSYPQVARAWEQGRSLSSEDISAEDFSRMVQEFSEESGKFYSDNFISNETSYLHVADKLRKLAGQGGAYVGVGPEQNFTYITKIRPRIAFIVDIRRQAVLQHLMYKALFQQADNRVEFLSLLFSKPLRKGAPGSGADLEKLLDYFAATPSSEPTYQANLAKVLETIETTFRFPLSLADRATLDHVYGAFQDGNLNIMFRFRRRGYRGYRWARFPTLKDLILATDLHGKRGNFLASERDYKFLRDLQRKNRVIPVVGDFAGRKALPAVGEYLRSHGYTVTAFYTSNVEQYLFSGETFGSFVENVRRFPLTEKSHFIRSARAVWSGWEPHPAYVSGHRMTTLLQSMSVFLQDHDQGLYPDYWSLVTTHYITGKEP